MTRTTRAAGVEASGRPDDDSGGIVRVPNVDRAYMPRATARDKSLTWEARGMLSYLLSHVGSWETRVSDLIKQSPKGATVVKRILRELKKKKYLRREKTRGADGRFKWVTTVYERPYLAPCIENPPMVEPSMVEPATETAAIKGSSYKGDQLPSNISYLRNEDMPPGVTATAESKPHQHPAIQLVKQLNSNRYPNKLLWPRIVKTLGEQPDVDFLTECATEAAARGRFADMTLWLFGWYADGRIPPRTSTGGSTPARPVTPPPVQQPPRRRDSLAEVDAMVDEADAQLKGGAHGRTRTQ